MVSSYAQEVGSSPIVVSSAGQLVMLSQRIGRGANENLIAEELSVENLRLVSRDLESFGGTAQSLLNGNVELHLLPMRNLQVRELLQSLQERYDQLRKEASVLFGNLQGIALVRDTYSAIRTDSDSAQEILGNLKQGLAGQEMPRNLRLTCTVLSVLLLIFGGVGLVKMFVIHQTARKIFGTILGISGVLIWYMPLAHVQIGGKIAYQAGNHIGGIAYLLLFSLLGYSVLSWLEQHIPRIIAASVALVVSLMFLFQAGSDAAWGLFGMIFFCIASIVAAVRDKIEASALELGATPQAAPPA